MAGTTSPPQTTVTQGTTGGSHSSFDPANPTTLNFASSSTNNTSATDIPHSTDSNSPDASTTNSLLSSPSSAENTLSTDLNSQTTSFSFTTDDASTFDFYF